MDTKYWYGISNFWVDNQYKECQRTPYEGIGQPEQLKGNLTGWWSRRIDIEHRLVYKAENDKLFILQCRKHC